LRPCAGLKNQTLEVLETKKNGGTLQGEVKKGRGGKIKKSTSFSFEDLTRGTTSPPEGGEGGGQKEWGVCVQNHKFNKKKGRTGTEGSLGTQAKSWRKIPIGDAESSQ